MIPRSRLSAPTVADAFCCFKRRPRVLNSSTSRHYGRLRQSILWSKDAAKLRGRGPTPKGSRGEGVVLLPGGHLLVAKEKKPAALIEFGPPHSRSRGLARGGALANGARWPIKRGRHRFVALAIWLPDKKLAKTCADFSDLEIGPDGCLYLLSDKSFTIARLDDLPAGGGTAALLDAWRLGDLDGKPEGLAFTAQGRAIVGLDTRKARRNLVLLEPAVAQLRGLGSRT
jgi:hypothetical protein